MRPPRNRLAQALEIPPSPSPPPQHIRPPRVIGLREVPDTIVAHSISGSKRTRALNILDGGRIRPGADASMRLPVWLQNGIEGPVDMPAELSAILPMVPSNPGPKNHDQDPERRRHRLCFTREGARARFAKVHEPRSGPPSPASPGHLCFWGPAPLPHTTGTNWRDFAFPHTWRNRSPSGRSTLHVAHSISSSTPCATPDRCSKGLTRYNRGTEDDGAEGRASQV